MRKFIIVKDIKVDIIRRLRTKTMRLKIDCKTRHPIISIPYFCSLSNAEKFIKQHYVWLTTQLKQTPPKIYFHDKMKLEMLGRSVTIVHIPEKRCGTFIENNFLYVSGDKEYLHRRVKDFIKNQVRHNDGEKALTFASLSHTHVKSVSVRDTVSRWGSCSSSGHLSFCWRLGLAPLFVLDYVIAHEVSHLKEMNHSYAFWKEVNSLYADAKKAKKWLSEHGKDLHQID